ncbi:NAD-dependent epimerase/dehydratase family protein [Methylobacter tundripaludum]|uniref:NAD-dependent epimerase/dehydratase n=1 Tax=Methylobacter tundripaludum (strain ATCC BAA-1195 / DSM 17260 / SV96) TaxID=697282 RepID=G3IVT3_METTV|nr:NAD(P)-dependent oxidoreductase [Methylobacter tundripaludum]EGW22940.1 NAD-dependent epimerase/dehydratase [Methylobacter tundripaludum SV96]
MVDNATPMTSLPEGDGLPLNLVGVLGATSSVGTCLLPMLTEAGWQVTAFSRSAVGQSGDRVAWRQLGFSSPAPLMESLAIQSGHQAATTLSPALSRAGEESISFWICVAPIWVLPDYFALLDAQGAKRVVVLSSTSRFTKEDSTDPEEQAIALRLTDAEARVREWAESRGVEWVILRPTLIYGLGRDKNIAEIARFIRRFGFFPLFGEANGLRQPIHVADVAGACLAALRAPCAANKAYNISGGETLTYRNMVARVFSALCRRLRLLTVPLWTFRLAVTMLRRLRRYRQWSAAMAERMNRDLVFDHADASRDLGFKPRAFVLSAEDVAHDTF